jgi:hypothetical protein
MRLISGKHCLLEVTFFWHYVHPSALLCALCLSDRNSEHVVGDSTLNFPGACVG